MDTMYNFFTIQDIVQISGSKIVNKGGMFYTEN
jgi:hypothetical protein